MELQKLEIKIERKIKIKLHQFLRYFSFLFLFFFNFGALSRLFEQRSNHFKQKIVKCYVRYHGDEKIWSISFWLVLVCFIPTDILDCFFSFFFLFCFPLFFFHHLAITILLLSFRLLDSSSAKVANDLFFFFF